MSHPQQTEDGGPAHTKEPWRVATNPGGYLDQPAFPSIRDNSGLPHGEDIVAMPLGDSETVKANAARIVACVNSLAGMNPDALGEVVDVAREILRTDEEAIEGLASLGIQPNETTTALTNRLRTALALLTARKGTR